tara:strand:+ start:9997 stop:11052 length:1056 start_codon:yes stop_codon:yes gene_type:complete
MSDKIDKLRSSYSIIFEELGKVEGPKGSTADAIQIVCPFHHDTDPSLGVFMGIGMDIPLGFFHCFGCGEKGHWNKLAEKLNLTKISAVNGKIKDKEEVNSKVSKLQRKLEQIDSTNSLEKLMQSIGNPAYYPWSEDIDWRGYPGKLIKQVGGLYLSEPHQSRKELVCFFPNKIGKRYYGGQKAYINKVKGRPSYLGTSGDWAHDYGLFPYNYTHDLIKKHKLKFVVIVEGARDALRLLMMGIPAMAILGAKQFTKEKLRFIIKTGVKHIFTMPDNDSGGTKMKNTVKEVIAEYTSTSPMKIRFNNLPLPKEYNKKGKLIKLDPDEVDEEIIFEYMDIIEDEFRYKFAPEFE